MTKKLLFHLSSGGDGSPGSSETPPITSLHGATSQRNPILLKNNAMMPQTTNVTDMYEVPHQYFRHAPTPTAFEQNKRDEALQYVTCAVPT
jgi:hypothetical protein